MRSPSRWLYPLAVALVVFALPRPAAAGEDEFFFKEGDKVVMLGDSITEQYLYSSYVELWSITRFPDWKMTFRNVGIGGDRSVGGNSRFQRDVVSLHPTALTVDFGMNDGGYRAFDEKLFKAYVDGLQGIADQAKAADIRVAWLTPSPVEKKQDGPALQGYNQTLEQFSAGVKYIADHNGGLFVDQFHPFVKVEEEARAADPKNRIGGGDEVHPGPPGQALMAWAILKGLHFPELVSAVEIDAAAGKVVREERCRAGDLEVKDGRVHFTRRDEALPYFPEEAASILKWVPIRDELNEYRLKVTGLQPGRYEVRLGGQKVAEHSAEELGAGVNLASAALAAGPVADQVRAVAKAVKDKNDYFHNRIFRGVTLAPVPDFVAKHLKREDIDAWREEAYRDRLEKMPDYDKAIQRALVIKPHDVEIVPVEK